MIQSFRCSNFRSFKDEASLSLEPIPAFHEFPGNIFQDGAFRVLGQAAIYGANASGKSNVVKAIGFMRNFVLISSRLGSVDAIPVEPFLLHPESGVRPSLFEVAFIHEGVSFRYGFCVSRNVVEEEWLYRSEAPRRKDRLCFERQAGNIQYGPGIPTAGRKAVNAATLLPNALLLPRLDQNNVETAKTVMRFFSGLVVLSGSNDERFENYTSQALSQTDSRGALLEIIRLADRTISDVGIDRKTISVGALPPPVRAALPSRLAEAENLDQTNVKMIRPDTAGTPVSFDMDGQESEGTAKLFHLSGPFHDILQNGRTAVVDELEAKLHPHLVAKILSLFQSRETNPRNAQLVFVTHDTHLLSFGNLRRDQVWFCEKDASGASDFYSLAEMKGVQVRKEANLERQYIRGRYGAIPFFA